MSITKIRSLFKSELVDRQIMRHNIRAWIRSIRFLGPRWVNRRPIKRISQGPK